MGWWLWDGYSSSRVAMDHVYVAAQSSHLPQEPILVFMNVALVTDEVCVMRETLPKNRTDNALKINM